MRTLLLAGGAATFLLAMALATSVRRAEPAARPASAPRTHTSTPSAPWVRRPTLPRRRPQLAEPVAASPAPTRGEDCARRYQLCVVDADSRAPVAGAQLLVDRGQGAVAVATADGDGHLTFDEHDPQPLTRAWIVAGGRPVRTIGAAELRDAQAGEATIEVTGFAHVRVHLWPPLDESERVSVLLSFRTQEHADALYADADDAIRYGALGPGAQVRVAPGAVRVTAILDSRIIAAGTVDLAPGESRDVTLQRTAPSFARIRVVDDAGQPISYATIRLEPPAPMPDSVASLVHDVTRVSTDESGVAIVPASDASPQRATVSLDGDDVAQIEVTGTGDRTVTVPDPIVVCILESPAGDALPITGYSKRFTYQGSSGRGLGMIGSGHSGPPYLRVVWNSLPPGPGHASLTSVTVNLYSGPYHGTATLTGPRDPCRIVAESPAG